MCGIVGFLDKTGGDHVPAGRTALAMLRALAWPGAGSAGLAVSGPATRGVGRRGWVVRVAPGEALVLEHLAPLGRVGSVEPSVRGGSLRFRFEPDDGVTPDDVERALGARRDGLEVLSLGERL